MVLVPPVISEQPFGSVSVAVTFTFWVAFGTRVIAALPFIVTFETVGAEMPTIT